MSRSRSFCFTLNNYPDKDWAYLDTLECKYMLYGKEVGKEGTPHLQGLCVFKHQRTLQQAIKLLKHCHVEIAIDVQASIVYCKKEGDFTERGIPPMTQKQKGDANIERYARAWEFAKAGNIESVDADIRIQCYNTLKTLAKDYAKAPPDLDDVCGLWFYGEPGTGKSYAARNNYGPYYLKETNKWWDSYQGEETVIIDEVESDQGKFIGHFLKKWADRYSFDAEVKGAKLIIRPKRIIVTSNYSIETVFGHDQVLLEAIRRRFKCVHFSSLFNKRVKSEPVHSACVADFVHPDSCK